MDEKYQRVDTLTYNIDTLDEKLNHDVQLGNTDALVVLLMRVTGMRVGNHQSIRGRTGNPSTYGATTLRAKHCSINREGLLILDFIGKKGVHQHYTVGHFLIVEQFRYLLHTRSGDDALFDDVTNKSTMSYLREALGVPDLKNHDLRTYVASITAKKEIMKWELPQTEKDYRLYRNHVGDVVAAQLGNNRYNALNSYIDPTVFDVWRQPGWNP